MNAAGTIVLALVLTIFGVAFFWYIWVKAFEWELAIWYRGVFQQRKEKEIEVMAADVEMGGSVAGSIAPSMKSNGEGGSKSGSKHGNKKSVGGSGSKAGSKKSGSKSGG
jgi:hypothetical protein